MATSAKGDESESHLRSSARTALLPRAAQQPQEKAEIPERRPTHPGIPDATNLAVHFQSGLISRHARRCVDVRHLLEFGGVPDDSITDATVSASRWHLAHPVP